MNPHAPRRDMCGNAIAGCNGTARIRMTITDGAGRDQLETDPLCSLCACRVLERLRPGWQVTFTRPATVPNLIGGRA